MAYIPRSMASDRSRFLATGAAGTTGAASGGVPISTPPQSPAGGQFAGLRAYFNANQPNAEALAGDVVSGLDTTAQSAVDKAAVSRGTLESAGGAAKAADAIATRDDARRQLDALGSQSGISALLEQRDPSASYTQGMRSADAALLGRSGAINDARDRWGGVLGALDPTYKLDPVQKPTVLPEPSHLPTYKRDQIDDLNDGQLDEWPELNPRRKRKEDY